MVSLELLSYVYWVYTSSMRYCVSMYLFVDLPLPLMDETLPLPLENTWSNTSSGHTRESEVTYRLTEQDVIGIIKNWL